MAVLILWAKHKPGLATVMKISGAHEGKRLAENHRVPHNLASRNMQMMDFEKALEKNWNTED